MSQRITSDADPAIDGVAVTPADGSDLPRGLCNGLWIGGAGNVAVEFNNTSRATVVFLGCTAGSILPIKAIKVRATSTTATNIVALY